MLYFFFKSPEHGFGFKFDIWLSYSFMFLFLIVIPYILIIDLWNVRTDNIILLWWCPVHARVNAVDGSPPQVVPPLSVVAVFGPPVPQQVPSL